MPLEFRRVSPIPNFTTICERQPLSKNWLDATTTLSEKLTGKHNVNLVLQEICRQLIEKEGLPSTVFNGAKASYATNPHIQNITGLDLPMPLIVFPRERRADFIRVSGRDSTVGFSTAINFAPILNTVGLEGPNLIRPLRVAVACEVDRSEVDSLEQNIRHETMHGLDPNLEYRCLPPEEPQQNLLSELVATVGEFARKESDKEKIFINPKFWNGYLNTETSPGMFDVFGLGNRTVVSSEEICQAISDTIGRLTEKLPNSELARLFMMSASFKELHEFLKVLLPQDYPSQVAVSSNQGDSACVVRVEDLRGRSHHGITVEVRPSRDAAAERMAEILRIIRDYYANWSKFYTLGSRSIQSNWQKPHYAEQAMRLFVVAESLPREEMKLSCFMATLEHFEEVSGHAFDKSNITNFKIERKELGTANHLIKVSW